MTGLFFGALGLGNLSDTIGRRKTMLIGVSCSLVLNIVLYFVNDPIGRAFECSSQEPIGYPVTGFLSTKEAYSMLRLRFIGLRASASG